MTLLPLSILLIRIKFDQPVILPYELLLPDQTIFPNSSQPLHLYIRRETCKAELLAVLPLILQEEPLTILVIVIWSPATF